MVMRKVTTLGALAAVGIAVHTAINLGRLRKPNAQVPPVDETVSVLIPARNEEHVIAQAITSVLAQVGVANMEVLVLDDNSTDATAAIVAAVQDARVRLIASAAEPPADWLGKPWACARLAQQSTGDVLVFIDADVRLAPDAIRASVRALRANAFDLVSPYPRQLASNWLARLTQPLVSWSWCALLPLGWAEQSRRASLAAANGQFLVRDADAYRKAGGHRQVADEVLEDVALMRAFKSADLRTCTMDGSELASCEMYDGVDETINGYAKSLWAAFGSPLGAIGVNAALFVVYIAPALAAVGSRSARLRAVGAMGYVAGVLSRSMVARRMGTRVWPDSALHPASVAAFMAINAESWRRHRMGTSIWKGRTL